MDQDTERRIQRKLKLAKALEITPARLRRYAAIAVAAEQWMESESISAEHTLRAQGESIGKFNGSREGAENPEEAWRKYRRGRQARQEVYNSAAPVVEHVEGLLDVVEKNREYLPEHVRTDKSFRDLKQTLYTLRTLRDLAGPRDDEALTPLKPLQTLTVRALTLLWWRFLVDKYPGKWDEMHRAAQCWRLTDADSGSFQRQVRKLSQGLTSIQECPRWALL